MTDVPEKNIDEDEFRMWRGVVAFALADGVLTLEEQKILNHHLRETPFSVRQREVLQKDITAPQNVEALFSELRSDKNRKRFCELARTLVWCDGDISRQENEILKRVSCFKTPENSKLLKASAESSFIKDYIKRYEDIMFIANQNPEPFFEVAA